jgi:hypothetical protein
VRRRPSPPNGRIFNRPNRASTGRPRCGDSESSEECRAKCRTAPLDRPRRANCGVKLQRKWSVGKNEVGGESGIPGTGFSSFRRFPPGLANSFRFRELITNPIGGPFRPFAALFRFCRRGGTRNDTRRGRLCRSLRKKVLRGFFLECEPLLSNLKVVLRPATRIGTDQFAKIADLDAPASPPNSQIGFSTGPTDE